MCRYSSTYYQLKKFSQETKKNVGVLLLSGVLCQRCERASIATFSHPNIRIRVFCTIVSVSRLDFNTAVEPQFNEPPYNEVLGLTNDSLQAGRIHSKMYERYLDITEPSF